MILTIHPKTNPTQPLFFQVKGNKSFLPVYRGIFQAVFRIMKCRINLNLKAIQEGIIPKDKRVGDSYVKLPGDIRAK